ncbi:MAG: circadian clock KaiB family protein [Candidatus Contendobacter sp.]|nr:circadian clock KaiB family protein [Candidatus Contendobacter sp.]
MRRKQIVKSPDLTTVTAVVMRLYVVSGAPNSVQALANLEAICQRQLKGSYQLEVVDVLEQPLRALADGVIVTPSLIKLSPPPAAQIVGNLSDKSKVQRALGLEEKIL